MEGQKFIRVYYKYLHCVLNMDESFMDLELYEGEQMMTEFSLLGELSL